MTNHLKRDGEKIDHLLDLTKKEASAFLKGVEDKPVGVYPDPIAGEELKEEGIGGENALEHFQKNMLRV